MLGSLYLQVIGKYRECALILKATKPQVISKSVYTIFRTYYIGCWRPQKVSTV